MKLRSLFFVLVLLMVISLGAQVTDKDGVVYNTVQIGSQIWMAENLNVSHFRNGDSIPEVEDATAWTRLGQEEKPAWCYYGTDPVYGRTYHKLYNWYAVNDPRGLCPNGWHVPSTLEWADLTDYLGGEQIAGVKMKAPYVWQNNGNGTNESGFEALPGGGRSSIGTFDLVGAYGTWWSSSETSAKGVWVRHLYFGSAAIYRSDGDKKDGLSVRCVKD